MIRTVNTSRLFSLVGVTLILASLLSTSDAFAAQSGNWSGTSTNVPPPNKGGTQARSQKVKRLLIPSL